MSDTLNPGLAERTLWPYAVGVQRPGEARPTYLHFDNKAAASLCAGLVDDGVNTVTRHVAVLHSHILRSVVLGWNEVEDFYGLPGASPSTEAVDAR